MCGLERDLRTSAAAREKGEVDSLSFNFGISGWLSVFHPTRFGLLFTRVKFSIENLEKVMVVYVTPRPPPRLLGMQRNLLKIVWDPDMSEAKSLSAYCLPPPSPVPTTPGGP